MRETTKVCPYCGDEHLVIYFGSSEKQCSGCYKIIPWYLETDQKPLFEGCVQKRKENEG